MSDKSDPEKNLMNYSFEDLDLNDNLLRGIYSYGFEKPSNIQYKSIPIINSGKDIIAQSQSGTGKTGAFSIGILWIYLLLKLLEKQILANQSWNYKKTHKLLWLRLVDYLI